MIQGYCDLKDAICITKIITYLTEILTREMQYTQASFSIKKVNTSLGSTFTLAADNTKAWGLLEISFPHF
jgi:hypothetical protein